jgi:hypothetical protein
VFTFGDAKFYGSLRGLLQREHRRLNRPIVAIKAMPDGYGYWLLNGSGQPETLSGGEVGGLANP